MAQLFRSLIFVPGNNSRFLEKAKNLQADIVCFDLEDSVPEKEKKQARKLIKTALKSRSDYISSIFVRTNSPASGKIPEDLKEIVQKGIDGIVVPKVNNIKELKKIEKNLQSLEKTRKLKPTQIIPSIDATPAAFASTGIFALEYFAPSGFFEYSIPKSFNKSNTPKTTAQIRLLCEAML